MTLLQLALFQTKGPISAMLLMEPTGQVYINQISCFITPLSHGNNYLLILYDYDSNSILAEPIKNHTTTATSLLAGYMTLHAKLCAAGLQPCLQCLNNECTEPLKQFL